MSYYRNCKGNLSKEENPVAERGHAMENKVEKLRKALGLNQEDFAKSVRVSRQTVSAIETGKYNPSLELAFIIADFFGKTIEEIFIYERKDKDEKK